MKSNILAGACAGALLLSSAATALAKEGGDQYLNGVEGWVSGAAPAPGWYFINYTGFFDGTLVDGNGDKVQMPKLANGVPTEMGPNGPVMHTSRIDAFYDTLRIVRMTDLHIGSAQYGFQALVPLVHMNMDIPALGGRVSSSGIEDPSIAPMILAWHHSPNLHTVFAPLTVNLGVGTYDKNDARKSISAHYSAWEPGYAVTWMQPGGWEASGVLMYSKKFKNTDYRIAPTDAVLVDGAPAVAGVPGSTGDYQSGDEVHMDFAIGHAVGGPIATVGLGGYYLQQTTPDRINGQKVVSTNVDGSEEIGNKGKVLAIGPSARLSLGPHGPHLMLSVQKEVLSENRFGDGVHAVLKVVTAF